MTALHNAAYHGDTAAIRTLVGAHAEVNAKSDSACVRAAAPCAMLHMASPAAGSASPGAGCRHRAARNGQRGVCRAHSAACRSTALHIAAESGCADGVAALIRAHADVNAQDNNGCALPHDDAPHVGVPSAPTMPHATRDMCDAQSACNAPRATCTVRRSCRRQRRANSPPLHGRRCTHGRRRAGPTRAPAAFLRRERRALRPDTPPARRRNTALHNAAWHGHACAIVELACAQPRADPSRLDDYG
jgi:hypothetical protein